jgi:CO/xanthine dehydrogenase FAD-binding subunit
MHDYARPRSLGEALALIGQGGRTIIAGGTDLYVRTSRRGLGAGVVDVTGIEGLAGIAHDGQHWRIGAATTWSAIAADSTLPPAFDGLRAAAREVGGWQIQNAGTIGGNLVNASPAADGVPALLILDAAVELQSADGVRHLPLEMFIAGPRSTALRDGELLTAVLVPLAAARGRAAFHKLGARQHLVISIAMAAARLELEDGVVTRAAVAVGACSPVARRLEAVEAALVGASRDVAGARVDRAQVAAALAPIDDVRATAAYRLDAATELVRRTVAQAFG